MKKHLWLCVLSALFICSCSEMNPPAEEWPAVEPVTTASDGSETTSMPDSRAPLEILREEMRLDGDGVAVAFLGCLEREEEAVESYLADSGALEAYPFLHQEMPAVIQAGGYELYLIVPQDPEARVTVRNWFLDESNAYKGEAGETVFYEKDSGAPFLLLCNVSDIWPSAVIQLEQSEPYGVMEYVPFLSLRDGSLALPISPEPFCGVRNITDES